MRKDKKSLAETHPELAKQWHPTKNGQLNPHNTGGKGSEIELFWGGFD